MVVEPTGSFAVEILATESFHATAPKVAPPAAKVALPKGSNPVEDVGPKMERKMPSSGTYPNSSDSGLFHHFL
jgi:hypothetical protein